MADEIEAYAGPVVTRQQAKAVGLKRYFNGRVCKRGHVAQSYVATANCCQCLHERVRGTGIQSSKAATRKAASDAGLIWYYTGIACRNGHVSKRYVNSGKCLDCAFVANSRRQALYPEEVKRYHREYYAANRLANPQAEAERGRRRYAADPVAHNKKTSRWKKSNPQAVRAMSSNRRTRIRGNGGKYTTEDVDRLLLLQKGRCAHSWCRRSLKKGFEVDHIIPVVLDGSSDRRNIQLLCKRCNRRKHAKHPIEYAQQNGLLL